MNLNIIDILIVAGIAISILFGMHRGFISSVLGIAAVIVSLIVAYTMSGQVAAYLQQNETIVNTLLYYTDASNRIGDLSISVLPASSMNSGMLQSIIDKANLPSSFENVFIEAIAKNTNSTQTISNILSRTIVDVSISIISFLITFLIAYLISIFVVHMISYVFELPVLRHMDAFIGGIFGGLRGILIIYVLFSLVPLIVAVVPIDAVSDVISQSQLAPYFDSKIIFMILNRL